jgi:hypothetical protein
MIYKQVGILTHEMTTRHYETQRKGIRIDMEVIPTIEGIAKGKDELLEKAIEIINTKK